MKALLFLSLCVTLVVRAEDPRIADITAKRKADDDAFRRELIAKLAVKPLPPMEPIKKSREPAAPTAVVVGTAATGGGVRLLKPCDDAQAKLDAIKRQLDMQAEQAKLEAFRQHQIENAKAFRATVERAARQRSRFFCRITAYLLAVATRKATIRDMDTARQHSTGGAIA